MVSGEDDAVELKASSTQVGNIEVSNVKQRGICGRNSWRK